MDNNEFNQPVNNQQYQQPNNGLQLEAPLSLGDWLITLIVLGIPCVNIIMAFIWGFGNGNTNRKNYCRAYLIILAVGVVLSLIFGASIAAMIANLANGNFNY